MTMAEAKLYLGIDLGGTFVKIGIVDDTGHICRKYSFPVDQDEYKTSILDTAVISTEKVLESTDCLSLSACPGLAGIGVSATGQIDPHTGTVVGAAGHIPNYIGSHIAENFHKAFNLNVAVANDADCSLLGECSYGAAQGARNVIMMTLGTGVGGGILVDGKLVSGSRGAAGEIGHIIINDDGEKCSCGNKGCLEHYASTKALVNKVRKAVSDGSISPSCLNHVSTTAYNDLSYINGKTIFEALSDSTCNGGSDRNVLFNIVDQWENYIADGLVSLVHIFNPDSIIIGGGVSEAGEMLVGPIRNKVLNRAMPSFTDGLSIKAAELGNESGMIGAVVNYRHQFCE
ncbi:MAG: ROK family protein [Lachnospiraceae bacterium]|jgi:glucokinase|nr:ROK family protein [Lachnospiraceae bacterium]MDD4525426.1 ROK family protein [Lachnospiraceae bacterium]